MVILIEGVPPNFSKRNDLYNQLSNMESKSGDAFSISVSPIPTAPEARPTLPCIRLKIYIDEYSLPHVKEIIDWATAIIRQYFRLAEISFAFSYRETVHGVTKIIDEAKRTRPCDICACPMEDMDADYGCPNCGKNRPYTTAVEV